MAKLDRVSNKSYDIRSTVITVPFGPLPEGYFDTLVKQGCILEEVRVADHANEAYVKVQLPEGTAFIGEDHVYEGEMHPGKLDHGAYGRLFRYTKSDGAIHYFQETVIYGSEFGGTIITLEGDEDVTQPWNPYRIPLTLSLIGYSSLFEDHNADLSDQGVTIDGYSEDEMQVRLPANTALLSSEKRSWSDEYEETHGEEVITVFRHYLSDGTTNDFTYTATYTFDQRGMVSRSDLFLGGQRDTF